VSDLTRILDRVQQGECKAADELLPLVYGELRRLASAKMAQQAPGQTLQATALVHEAWLKLAANDRTSGMIKNTSSAPRGSDAPDSGGSVSVQAKSQTWLGQIRVNLEEVDVAAEAKPEVVLLVDEALEVLTREDAGKAELVKLRFYRGLSVAETAAALGVSEKTVKRHWIHARAWLFREVRG